MNKMRVPFFDLKRQYERDSNELKRSLARVFVTGQFILGGEVRALEKAISRLCRTPYAIGVASGSDALWLGLWALGVGSGDEVITTPYTFISTVTAILKTGARPVFADIEEDGFSLELSKVEAAVSKRTKAILPVHLFGLCADMSRLNRIARDAGLWMVEDAAQALGALFQGRPAGSMGDMAALSFYPTKNLGGAGDGGMILTRRASLAKRLRMLRAHGASKKYFHPLIGWNSRLDEIQAAILLVKLRRLKTFVQARRRIAKEYLAHLSDLPLILPQEPRSFYHAYHQFVIRTPLRDRLQKFLAKQGIGTEIYYPRPLHLQPCFSSLGYGRGDFPNAEKRARESLALPIFPEMTDREIRDVIRFVRAFFEKR